MKKVSWLICLFSTSGMEYLHEAAAAAAAENDKGIEAGREGPVA